VPAGAAVAKVDGSCGAGDGGPGVNGSGGGPYALGLYEPGDRIPVWGSWVAPSINLKFPFEALGPAFDQKSNARVPSGETSSMCSWLVFEDESPSTSTDTVSTKVVRSVLTPSPTKITDGYGLVLEYAKSELPLAEIAPLLQYLVLELVA
jgi:hypothetical protein